MTISHRAMHGLNIQLFIRLHIPFFNDINFPICIICNHIRCLGSRNIDKINMCGRARFSELINLLCWRIHELVVDYVLNLLVS